jgi:hypothetical protein
MHTVTDTLRQLGDRLPGDPVSRVAQTRLEALASRLPAALSSRVYIECRLGFRAPQVDLIVGVDRRGSELLTGRYPGVGLAPKDCRHPVWRRVGDLCRAWWDPAGPLGAALHLVWLEFDLCGEPVSDEMPVPGIFADFLPVLADGSGSRSANALAEAALRPLWGSPVAGRLRRSLGRCFAHLPPGAGVASLGVFPSRSGDAVRVCIQGLSDPQIPVYLAAAGWPARGDELREVLAELRRSRPPGAGANAAVVHLDVDGDVSPRLGLEYGLPRRSQLHGRFRDTSLLDHLVARGLCSPHKRKALLRWPRASRATFPHELWPSIAARWLNHVKVAYEGGSIFDAKGYLYHHHVYAGSTRVG